MIHEAHPFTQATRSEFSSHSLLAIRRHCLAVQNRGCVFLNVFFRTRCHESKERTRKGAMKSLRYLEIQNFFLFAKKRFEAF